MQKILIFNFYDGILKRGIPIYTNNLLVPLSRLNKVRVIRAPRWLSDKPRIIIDIFFVFYEQIITPLISLFGGYHKVIYPYNSCSILSSLLGNSLLIIHDFIPNKLFKSKKSISLIYIVITQYIHEKLNRDVAFVSKTTMRLANSINNIKGCRKFYFPNSFYILEGYIKDKFNNLKSDNIDDYILLMSGNGKNKEFDKALDLFISLRTSLKLKVIGFGNQKKLAELILMRKGYKNIEILPLLSDLDLSENILNAKFIWVHSTAEGFGRPLIEGRMGGKSVLATNISAFREHKDKHTYLYNLSNNESFLSQFKNALNDKNIMPFIT